MLKGIPDYSWQKLNAALSLYQTEFGKTLKEIIPQQTKLLAHELMDQTPPWPNGTDGTSKTGEAVGKAAVERDIARAVTRKDILLKGQTTDNTLDKLFKRRDYTKINERISHYPQLKKWTAVPFDEQLHLRTRRYKGHMKEQFKFTPDVNKHKQYVKKIQDRVGYVKSGWAFIAHQFGDNTIPKWVSKHYAYTKGKLDQSQLDAENPLIGFENEVPLNVVSKMTYGIEKRSREMMEDIAFKSAYKARQAGLVNN